MAHKAKFFTDSNAIGSKSSGNVLCNFNITAGGSKNLRLEVHSSDGLDSAIDLANALKATWNAHLADATEHTASVDAVNTTAAADATDLTSLITLTTELLVDYAAHDGDVDEVTPTYHAATSTLNNLASAAAPTTLAECITRLNDIKAKYNLHEADSTSHGVGSENTESTDNAAVADTNWKLQTSIRSGDDAYWVDADESSAQIASDYAELVVTEGDADTPLRPIARIVATGDITTTVVAVIQDW